MKLRDGVIKKVQVWVTRRGSTGLYEFLLLKTTPERGSFWQPVTGGVHEGETFVSAAIRELKEETGYELSEQPDPLWYEFEYSKNGKEFYESCFFVKLPESLEKKDPVLDSKEHVEYQWADFKECLNSLKYESNQNALKKLVKRLL